jgi:hypothetical protein
MPFGLKRAGAMYQRGIQ